MTTTRRPRVAKTSYDDATGITRGTIELARGHVAFESRGSDERHAPLLLLRPLAGSMALWGAFRDLLAKRFRVIAFDPRGVGLSSRAPLTVTTRTMAREAVAVLDALDVRRAHVFGISLGAMVATWVAVDAPERVDRLCLASAGRRGFEITPSAALRGVAMATSLLAPGKKVTARVAKAVLSRDVRRNDPATLAAVEAAAAHDAARRTEIVAHLLAAARHDARSVLHRIDTPTLVLAGDRDELIGTQPSRDLADAIRGARFEIVPGGGHDLAVERPIECAACVVRFLQTATVPTRPKPAKRSPRRRGSP